MQVGDKVKYINDIGDIVGTNFGTNYCLGIDNEGKNIEVGWIGTIAKIYDSIEEIEKDYSGIPQSMKNLMAPHAPFFFFADVLIACGPAVCFESVEEQRVPCDCPNVFILGCQNKNHY